MTKHIISGPFFEDFEIGQVFGAPAVTVTEGIASVYQSIVGDRLRLALDRTLSEKVTGERRGFVHPMLTINIVNGQTTYASQNVKGNLFYRGLLLQTPVFIGDTLNTTTKVVGLRQNTFKEGRDATGMVVLEMETVNQTGLTVLKYWRCPMIACRNPNADTGYSDSFDWIPERLTEDQLIHSLPTTWKVKQLTEQPVNLPLNSYAVGDEISVIPQDSVTNAPELVRLTGNIAYAHTDPSKSYLGKRLVYGGHTISLAFAQVVRAIPNIINLVGWQGCDHLAPVLEEDIIQSNFKISRILPVKAGGSLYSLQVKTVAKRLVAEDSSLSESNVLGWDLVIWGL